MEFTLIEVPMIWALAAKMANSKCFIPSILSHTALQKPYPSCCHLIGKNYSSCSYIGNCLSNLIQLNSYQSKFKCPNLFCQHSGDTNALDPSALNQLNSDFSRVSLWHFFEFTLWNVKKTLAAKPSIAAIWPLRSFFIRLML